MGTKELLLAGFRPKYGAGIGKTLALDGNRDSTALGKRDLPGHGMRDFLSLVSWGFITSQLKKRSSGERIN